MHSAAFFMLRCAPISAMRAPSAVSSRCVIGAVRGMSPIIATGAGCLGILIGILVAYFVEEAKAMTFRVLSSAVTIFAGGGVLAVFHLVGMTKPTEEYWFYPIGLLVGFGVGTYLHWLYSRKGW